MHKVVTPGSFWIVLTFGLTMLFAFCAITGTRIRLSVVIAVVGLIILYHLDQVGLA